MQGVHGELDQHSDGALRASVHLQRVRPDDQQRVPHLQEEGDSSGQDIRNVMQATYQSQYLTLLRKIYYLFMNYFLKTKYLNLGVLGFWGFGVLCFGVLVAF